MDETMKPAAALVPPAPDATATLDQIGRWSSSFVGPAPERGYLLRHKDGGFMPAGKLCLLASPGGKGKTALLMHLAIHVAAGRPWLGLDVVKPGAVAMVLGGISGSAVANAAAVGGVMIAAMSRAGYPAPFSASIVGAAAATDILIPPSIAFIDELVLELRHLVPGEAALRVEEVHLVHGAIHEGVAHLRGEDPHAPPADAAPHS